jgi:hypothetical protein
MQENDHSDDSVRFVEDEEFEFEFDLDSQSQMLQFDTDHSIVNHSAVHPIQSISRLLLHFDLQSPNVADEHRLFHHRECGWNNVLVQCEMF